LHARAQWAAIRTFHRKVKLVGETASGQPVFALGEVQLTLPVGAQHFYPVGACSRCGEIVEFPEPVLSTADLDVSRQPHLCQKCARTGIDTSGSVRSLAQLVAPAGGEPDVGGPASSGADAPSTQAGSGATEGRLVPAVREPRDIDQLVRPGADVFWGVAGQTTRPGDDNGSGDGFDRVGEYVAVVLRSAMLQADEIRADAERAAAEVLEEAEEHAAQQRAAAALAQEAADNDRDQVVALRAELEETLARQQRQVTGLVSEAEAQAAAIRAAAEADAIRIRESAADSAIAAEAERITALATRTTDRPVPEPVARQEPEPEARA